MPVSGSIPRGCFPRRSPAAASRKTLCRLSGGTREQIAILTRLAFARLLARTGRATPVILDDAVVYADDDRFARVLDAIAAVAADVQVIVLTCRERSFAGVPAIRPALSCVEHRERRPRCDGVEGVDAFCFWLSCVRDFITLALSSEVQNGAARTAYRRKRLGSPVMLTTGRSGHRSLPKRP